ncbi:MAG: hypothetical protein J0H17_08300 [Rhizobiales bacterium]|nr:hypothetical protein [Hyphomicrobiales bacterium]
MRRQTVLGGEVPAGSGCHARLDPLALPVRFTAQDAVADGQVRHVELDHARMRVRRSVRGMTISVNVPVANFLGVVVRRVAEGEGHGEAVSICLEHRDPALSTTVFEAPENCDIEAEWQLWARVLGLPLLVAEDGALREPFPRMGGVRVGAVGQRRRRRNAIKRRRSTMVLRRQACPRQEMPVIRGEREIIARN